MSPARSGPLLSVACAAALATGCAKQPARETLPLPHNEPTPILQDDAIHIPVAIVPQGCVLYSIEMPGGQASPALIYRSDDGSFSYARPQRCEEAEKGRQAIGEALNLPGTGIFPAGTVRCGSRDARTAARCAPGRRLSLALCLAATSRLHTPLLDQDCDGDRLVRNEAMFAALRGIALGDILDVRALAGLEPAD